MKKIINFGCGKTRIPESIGVDRTSIPGFTDITHDLDSLPYPFESESVDEIHCYHVLEHLSHPLRVVEEFHRLLKPNGILNIRVPHFSSHGAFTDITHIRPFSYYSFDPFIEGDYQNFYTSARFEILNREIKYFGQYPNSGIYAQYIHPNKCPTLIKPLVRALNFCINLSPIFFERIWCYWVGGACEVVITLKKSAH